MKINIIEITKIFTVLMLISFGLLSACDESINLAELDESNYQLPDDVIGFITNSEGKLKHSFIDFRDSGSEDIYIGLNETAASSATVSFTVDPSILETYNATYNTNYMLFPESEITLPEQVTIESGKKISNKASLNFTTSEALETE